MQLTSASTAAAMPSSPVPPLTPPPSMSPSPAAAAAEAGRRGPRPRRKDAHGHPRRLPPRPPEHRPQRHRLGWHRRRHHTILVLFRTTLRSSSKDSTGNGWSRGIGNFGRLKAQKVQALPSRSAQLKREGSNRTA